MKKTDRNALVAFFVVVILGAFIAWAGSQGGRQFGDIPLFALATGLIFLIQWLVFIPSFLRQSEQFFDLTGSVTYISIVTLAFILSKEVDLRTTVLWALVVIWAARLGIFLFRRIRREGPYFTTDTAASLRAMEIHADVLLKATKVDGVYDADPVTHPVATRYSRLEYADLLRDQLKVLDATAVSLCMENHLPIVVFDLNEPDNITRVVLGDEVGTLIAASSSGGTSA